MFNLVQTITCIKHAIASRKGLFFMSYFLLGLVGFDCKFQVLLFTLITVAIDLQFFMLNYFKIQIFCMSLDICEFLLMCYFWLLGILQMYVNTFMSIILNLDAFVANNKRRGSLVIKLLSSTYKVRTMIFFLKSLCRYWNQLQYS